MAREKLEAHLGKHLSQNIEQLRRIREWSQDALAKKAGVPRATLAHMESGNGNPSLTNLVRVAEALGTSIDELLSRPRPDIKHIRSDELRKNAKHRSGVSIQKLLPDPFPGYEIDLIEFAPNARMKGNPHLEGTKEYLYCLAGAVTLHTQGKKIELETGDLVAFRGDQAHAYVNPNASKKTRCFSVVVRT